MDPLARVNLDFPPCRTCLTARTKTLMGCHSRDMQMSPTIRSCATIT